MKLFKIESVHVAFDEDEAMVVAAKNSSRALELAKDCWVFREGKDINRIRFIIKEIDINTELVISIAHYGN